MSSPSKSRKGRQRPSAGAGGGKASQHTSSTSRGGTSPSKTAGRAGERSPRTEQTQKGAAPNQKRPPSGSGGSSRSTSQESAHTQKSSHDLTAPIRKRTSTSGSRDEGEGGPKEGEGHKDQTGATAKKPTTKAERRALQVKGHHTKKYFTNIFDLFRRLKDKLRLRGK